MEVTLLININQNTLLDKHKVKAILGIEPFELFINKEDVERDIESIRQQEEKAKNLINSNNLLRIREYLSRLLGKVDSSGKLELCWSERNGRVSTYPVEFDEIKEYDIDTVKYVCVDSHKALVEVDDSIIADMIAYEMMYRDIGDELADIEVKLKDCHIVGMTSSDILKGFFKDIDIKPYELSRQIKLMDSPYVDVEDHRFVEYFTSDIVPLKDVNYHSVVTKVCRKINTIITGQIVKDIKGAEPIAIMATKMAFMVDRGIIENFRSQFEAVTVRVFGRKFKIEFNIQEL